PGLTVQNEVVLDGSYSFDIEDTNNIVYRWDFNGDGKWDTEFVKKSTHSVKYEIPGEKRAVLQVMDSSGLTDESEVLFSLNYGLNHGEEPTSKELYDIYMRINDAIVD